LERPVGTKLASAAKREGSMTAFNVVRFRVKPRGEQKFLDFNRKASVSADGFRCGVLVKTGERAYCLIGEW
jgi:hypothetical protein